jgi:uncharacterized protein (TIGR02611 family)
MYTIAVSYLSGRPDTGCFTTVLRKTLREAYSIDMEKIKKQTKRIAIGIVGGLVVIIGIIAVPYPGPGWLIVFSGLAILATEFAWAQRVLDFAKGYYEEWKAWLRRQSPSVRLAVIIVTGLVVITTLWLVNAFGLVNTWLHLPFDWVQSPLV